MNTKYLRTKAEPKKCDSGKEYDLDEAGNKTLLCFPEDDHAPIPCEFCNTNIPACDLMLHETGCAPDVVSYADPNPEDDVKRSVASKTASSLISGGFQMADQCNTSPTAPQLSPSLGDRFGDISPNVAEVTWNIEGFFSLPPDIDYWIRSPTFSFAGCEWRLSVWPNGNNFSPNCYVSLQKRETGPSAFPVFKWTIGLKQDDGAVHSSTSGKMSFATAQRRWLFICGSEFLSQTELLEQKDVIAPQGCVKIFCRLASGTTTEVPDQKENFSSVDTLSSNLKDLYLSGEDCDVTIELKGKEFKAHRAILRSRTPVLSAMFSHDMAENQSNAISIVDCDPDAFHEFLLFVYSGKAGNLSDENVINVYYIADKYDLPELKKACVHFMKTALSSNTICDVIRLATSHNEHQLLAEATDFFTQNVEEIILTVKWQRFLRENSTQANELLIKTFKTSYVKKQ